MCVQGTPPKGVLIVMSRDSAVYIDSGEARKLRVAESKVLAAFHDEVLNDSRSSLTVSPDGKVSTH